MISSTFGNDSLFPYVEELAAYTNRLIPASREAISIFRKPLIFTSFVVAGSFTLRGTEPSAASCNTYSIPSTARRQSSGFRISPTINRNRSGYCCNNGNRFSIFPVAKLSRQRTSCPSPNKASHKLEPINPAPPVTKIFCISFPYFLYPFS